MLRFVRAHSLLPKAPPPKLPLFYLLTFQLLTSGGLNLLLQLQTRCLPLRWPTRASNVRPTRFSSSPSPPFLLLFEKQLFSSALPRLLSPQVQYTSKLILSSRYFLRVFALYRCRRYVNELDSRWTTREGREGRGCVCRCVLIQALSLLFLLIFGSDP